MSSPLCPHYRHKAQSAAAWRKAEKNHKLPRCDMLYFLSCGSCVSLPRLPNCHKVKGLCVCVYLIQLPLWGTFFGNKFQDMILVLVCT